MNSFKFRPTVAYCGYTEPEWVVYCAYWRHGLKASSLCCAAYLFACMQWIFARILILYTRSVSDGRPMWLGSFSCDFHFTRIYIIKGIMSVCLSVCCQWPAERLGRSRPNLAETHVDPRSVLVKVKVIYLRVRYNRIHDSDTWRTTMKHPRSSIEYAVPPGDG